MIYYAIIYDNELSLNKTVKQSYAIFVDERRRGHHILHLSTVGKKKNRRVRAGICLVEYLN